jgi:hypothetical protein
MTTKSYHVTGDIDSFKQNQVLTDPKEIASYYRTIANEGADNPTSLTDAQILAIVSSIEGDDEDSEVERVQLIEAGVTKSEAAE